MKNIKISHILFSLALIAALGLAALPMAPAHALSAGSSAAPALVANQYAAPTLVSPNVLVCRSIIVWRHGHRVVVRRCHRVANQPV